MTNIVDQRSQSHNAPFVLVGNHSIGELASDVEYAYRVIEPCMNSAWV